MSVNQGGSIYPVMRGLDHVSTYGAKPEHKHKKADPGHPAIGAHCIAHFLSFNLPSKPICGVLSSRYGTHPAKIDCRCPDQRPQTQAQTQHTGKFNAASSSPYGLASMQNWGNPH